MYYYIIHLEKMWCNEGCGVIENIFWKPKGVRCNTFCWHGSGQVASATLDQKTASPKDRDYTCNPKFVKRH